MGSATFYPQVVGDDAYAGPSFMLSDLDFVRFGDYSANNLGCFIRFPSVTIPQGYTITSAFVRFTAHSDLSATTCNAKIYFNDHDDAVAPTTYSQFWALDLTTESVDWDAIAGWTDGTTYDSPSLVDALQEVVDRGGFSSGNAVMLVIHDNSSTGNAYRNFSSVDFDSGSEKAELHVTWAVNVNATCTDLTLTTNTALISYDLDIETTSVALSAATFAAVVFPDVLVEAETVSLTITAHTAIFNVDVSCTSVSLTTATYQAAVAIVLEVPASLVTLSLTVYDATVAIDLWVIAETLRMYDTTAIGFGETSESDIELSDTVGCDIATLVADFLDFCETVHNNWTGTEIVESGVGLYDALFWSWIETVSDEIDISDAVIGDVSLLIQDYLDIRETIISNWTGTETVESVLDYADTLFYGWIKTISDEIDVSDAVVGDVGLLIQDYLDVKEAIVSNWTGTETVETTLQLLGQLIIGEIFNETATSTVNVTDSVAYLHQMISAISDAIELGDTISSLAHWYPIVAESLAITGAVAVLTNFQNTNSETLNLSDTAGFGWADSLTDAFSITDTSTLLRFCVDVVTSNIELTETVLGLFQFDDTISDLIEFAATSVLNQVLTSEISETLNFEIVVELDDELWECWVLNTNAFHASVYSGYNFNSYAVYNNTAYGCKTDGIFELTGSEDDGAAFKAGVVLPETYFGINNKKRFRKAYFGLSGGTTPSLRVETDSGNKTYTISNNKARMTRDMYGRQWTLKIQDFDSVDFVELLPVILAR